MTTTGTGAYETMLRHHRVLSEQLAGRAEAVSAAVAAGQPHGAAAADLIAYLAEEVLPHAVAEEKTIYPAAAAHPDLAGLVAEMLAEHVSLTTASSRLAALANGAEAAEQAEQIAGLFTAHAAKENDLLLPALLKDESVNLAALLGQMHHYSEEDGTQAPEGAGQAEDPQAIVLSLLLQGASALARVGEADRACRLAASAWAALHETRPDLAAKVTAVLHGLARRTGSQAPDGSPDDGGVGPTPEPIAVEDPDLDVRQVAHAQRHGLIFTAYQALQPGRGFVLVNDHDPLPLRFQFEAQYPDEHTWDYLQAGPKVWRVRIGRAGA